MTPATRHLLVVDEVHRVEAQDLYTKPTTYSAQREIRVMLIISDLHDKSDVSIGPTTPKVVQHDLIKECLRPISDSEFV